MAYVQERDRLTVVELRERDFVAEHLEPYVVGAIPIEPSPTPQDRVFWGPTVNRADLERATSDPSFRSLITLRIDRTDLAHRFSIGLGRTIDRVLEELGG